MLTDLANFANPADSSLVFGMILGTIEGTFFVRCAAVDWCMAGSTNLELRKLIKLDVNGVVRISFALCFGSPSLVRLDLSATVNFNLLLLYQRKTHILYDLRGSTVGNNSIGKAQGRIVILVLDSQLHGTEKG